MRFPIAAAVLTAGVLLTALPAWAEKDADAPEPGNSLTGKIQSVEKKGRTLVLSIESDKGETSEQILSTRTPVIVRGEADHGLLRPGMAVYTNVVENKANKKLFGKEFLVYLDGTNVRGVKRGKTPETAELIELIGLIVNLSAKEMTLDLGRAGPGIVQLENDYKVKLESTNRDLITAGAKIEMTGKPIRGGHFRPTSVEVTLAEPLNSQAFFAAEESGSKRNSKRSRNASTASKSKKKGKDAADEPVVNPFAEIDKKTDK